MRASALQTSWALAKSIREDLAPTSARVEEASLFEIVPEGQAAAAPPGSRQGDSRTPKGCSSSELPAAAAAAATSAATPAAAAAAEPHEDAGCGSGGDGGTGGGTGGCLKPGDLEAAAAAGCCSWCCCAFPRLSIPQVSQSTIRRLFLMQRHNFEIAGESFFPALPKSAVGCLYLSVSASSLCFPADPKPAAASLFLCLSLCLSLSHCLFCAAASLLPSFCGGGTLAVSIFAVTQAFGGSALPCSPQELASLWGRLSWRTRREW